MILKQKYQKTSSTSEPSETKSALLDKYKTESQKEMDGY